MLGERSPLRVAHDPLPIAAANAAEFASRYQRRFRRPGITALCAHDVGEVDPAGLAFTSSCPDVGIGIRNLPYLQHFGTTELD